MRAKDQTAATSEKATWSGWERKGALVGVVLFVAVGLIPVVVFGGFAGAGLAAKLIGAKLAGGWLSRILVAAAMLVSVALGTLVFATAGWAVAAVLEAAFKPARSAARVEPLTAPVAARKTSRDPWAVRGAAIAFGLFLAVGALPAVIYGAFMGVALATKVLGAPLAAGWLARGIVLATSAAVFMAGAVVASATGAAIAKMVGHALRAPAVVTAEQPNPAPAATATPVTRSAGTANATFFGGVIGLALFLVIGLLPSLVYGGFAGAILGSDLLGHPMSQTLLARGIVIFGMVVSLLAVGGLFVVGGAALATGVYSLARSLGLVRRERKSDEPAQAHDIVL